MRLSKKKLRNFRSWPVIAAVVILLLGCGYLGLRAWYNRNLAAVSSSTQTVYFPVTSGSSVQEIANDLKNAHLIRSASAFETYVRSRQAFASLQAGTYALSPSMSTPQIIDKMVKGEVSRSYLTILPGKTIKQIRQTFKQAGYGDAELDVAFDPSTYPDESVLNSLPPAASLEGFLYPDTFQKDADTPATTIVRESLDEMQKQLTADIVNGFVAQGLTTYQGVTLASIVYKESGNPTYDPAIARVFLNRLASGMALGSDVTAIYGAIKDGVPLPDNTTQADNIAIAHDSPYNTRIHAGLPPGPIDNMPSEALKSVAHPSNNDYLFFVNGNDCKIHFARTETEHEQNIQKYGAAECQ
ncbi:MAG TPA: endolytic transglycosylase MltG [Candidatus Saccharimonadales bacterium]|nr:endolytic transglycosylase MltG [Candidatus Saccharimonadales bacterium]